MHDVTNCHQLSVKRAFGLLHFSFLGSQPLLDLVRALHQLLRFFFLRALHSDTGSQHRTLRAHRNPRRKETYGFELPNLLAGRIKLLADFVQFELSCSGESPWGQRPVGDVQGLREGMDSKFLLVRHAWSRSMMSSTSSTLAKRLRRDSRTSFGLPPLSARRRLMSSISARDGCAAAEQD
jgi:hypothetical protein